MRQGNGYKYTTWLYFFAERILYDFNFFHIVSIFFYYGGLVTYSHDSHYIFFKRGKVTKKWPFICQVSHRRKKKYVDYVESDHI